MRQPWGLSQFSRSENGTVPLGTTENATIPLGTTKNATLSPPSAALADKQPVPPGENGTVPLGTTARPEQAGRAGGRYQAK